MLNKEPKYYGACKVCGQPVKYKDAMYCSRACRYTVSKVSPTPECLACGKPVRQHQNKYCSRACASSAKRTIRLCIVCGKPITGRGDKYCSPECYAITRKPETDIENCLICGAVLKDKGAKYCSIKCSSEAHKTWTPKACPICGKPVITKSKQAKYCSRECLNQSIKIAREAFTKKCFVCGKPTSVNYRGAKYCSDECKKKARDATPRKKCATVGLCLICGKPNKTSQSKYCSHECAGKAIRVRSSSVCEICGKPTATFPGAKYCSKECMRIAQAKEPGNKCLICGNPTSSVRNKYCSRECLYKSLRTTQARTYKCKKCGKEFIPKSKERISYCSNACKYADWSAWQGVTDKQERRPKPETKPIEAFVCYECGETIKAEDATGRYCSRECAKEHHRRIARASLAQVKPLVARICKCCGRSYTPLYGDKRLDYCSTECGRKHHGAIAKRYRRAIEKGVESERVDPLMVYERDGWRCGICGELVDKTLTFPDRACATLDHIRPLAKGGTHTYDNVQCSHFQCNMIKGAQYQEQVLVNSMQYMYVLQSINSSI